MICMKFLILAILLFSICPLLYSQEFKVSVLNDTTELHQYDNGQKIKVIYKLNNNTLSIRKKEQLLQDHPGINQDFNIKTEGNEVKGEISYFLDEGHSKYINSGNSLTVAALNKIDIATNIKGLGFPLFSWTDIRGNDFSNTQLKGRTVVLNFWHTSCIPCVAEIPILNSLVKQYAGKEVVFIASTPNSRDELKSFLMKKEFNYQQVAAIDPKTIFSPFPGWPVHLVLNKEGLIQFYALGKQNNIEQKLIQSIEESLK
jgi:thiol-disulfide isomerase/thioredoxin